MSEAVSVARSGTLPAGVLEGADGFGLKAHGAPTFPDTPPTVILKQDCLFVSRICRLTALGRNVGRRGYRPPLGLDRTRQRRRSLCSAEEPANVERVDRVGFVRQLHDARDAARASWSSYSTLVKGADRCYETRVEKSTC